MKSKKTYEIKPLLISNLLISKIHNSRLKIFYRKKEIKLGASRLNPNLAQRLWEKSLQLIREAQTN